MAILIQLDSVPLWSKGDDVPAEVVAHRRSGCARWSPEERRRAIPGGAAWKAGDGDATATGCITWHGEISVVDRAAAQSWGSRSWSGKVSARSPADTQDALNAATASAAVTAGRR